MSGKVNYEFKGSCLSFMNSTETFVEGDDDFEDEFEEDTELHVSYLARTYSFNILKLHLYC